MRVAAIAFLMVLLMRFLAAIIVWLIVVLAAVGSLGLCDACFSVKQWFLAAKFSSP